MQTLRLYTYSSAEIFYDVLCYLLRLSPKVNFIFVIKISLLLFLLWVFLTNYTCSSLPAQMLFLPRQAWRALITNLGAGEGGTSLYYI